MTMTMTQEEYEILKNIHLQTIKMSGEWECSLETKYEEDQQLDIISMVSYLDNKQRGFGKMNDEQHYKNICDTDFDGKLRKEAKIGFEFAKKCFQMRTTLKNWIIENKNSHFNYKTNHKK